MKNVPLPGLLCLALAMAVGAALAPPTAPAGVVRRAMASSRPVEAWLSTGRGHAACTPMPVADDAVPWRSCQSGSAGLLQAAAGVSIAELEPHLSGVLRLSAPAPAGQRGLDEAILELDEAQRASPSQTDIANDLAAALIERAGRLDEPADLVAALDLLEKTSRRSPDPRLRFNRALALEKLQLLTVARGAWGSFLETNPGPRWEDEARARLKALEGRLAGDPAAADRLSRAALAGGAGELARLATREARAAREFALDVALPSWGQAVLAGDANGAARWISAASTIGSQAARAGRDRTADAAVAGILAAGPSSATERDLAIAYRLFGAARRSFAARDYVRAEGQLAEAASSLAALESPVAEWALRDLGSTQVQTSRNEVALETLAPVLERCAPEVRPALCGRTRWAMGLALFRLGRLGDALSTYRTAADHFAAAGEPDNRAAVLGLVAETERQLGDSGGAWRHRYRALRLLSTTPSHRSLHNLLWEAGDAALEEGHPHAAALFVEEDVARFGRGADHLLALESHLRRALIGRGHAPAREVVADLERAQALARRLPPSASRERVDAELLLALADVAGRGAGGSGEAAFDRAVEFFREHGLVVREAAALLARSRSRAAGGRHDEVEGDLEVAARLFEGQRAQLADEADRRLYSETWQGVYDALIAYAAERPGGERRALELLERSRAGGDPAGNGTMASQLGAEQTILTYALHHDRTYRFQLVGTVVRMERLAIGREEVARRVESFTAALRDGRWAPDPALARMLVPEVPGGVRLCFAPDRELSALPFAALPLADGTGPLLVRHAVRIGQTVHDCQATTGAALLPRNGRGVVLAGAPKLDPAEFPRLAGLPAAASELDALRRLYPAATLLTGEHATAPALLDALSGAAVLHFAGHGVAHPRDPSRAFLPLARDPGWPGASVIAASDLRALRLPGLRLAVLAACDTATPRPGRAEGISGLARALLDAGAPEVVAALWSVEDRSSRALVVELHRRLQRGGDAASALRGAQLHLIRHPDPNLRNPATWAAFQLIVSGRD